MRHAAKRDENERGIIFALELAGWGVIAVSSPGIPDLYVIRRGVGLFLEVKMPGKKLTPKQVETHARMAAHGMRVAVVTSADEALAAIGVTAVRPEDQVLEVPDGTAQRSPRTGREVPLLDRVRAAMPGPDEMVGQRRLRALATSASRPAPKRSRSSAQPVDFSEPPDRPCDCEDVGLSCEDCDTRPPAPKKGGGRG